MTEFFYVTDCGHSSHNQTTVKHHFTFGTHYEPTKLGRSTLRRLDHITLNIEYETQIYKSQTLYIYAFDAVSLKINDNTHSISANSLMHFDVSENDKIYLKSETQTDLVLAACDPDPANKIQILDITSETETPNNPFFGYVLEGQVEIDTKILEPFNGFYTKSQTSYKGTGKILTFSMPQTL